MHIRARLRNRYIGSQMGNHAVIKSAYILLPVLVGPGNGHKHVCRMIVESRSAYGEREYSRHDANHGVRCPVEKTRMPERLRRSAKRTFCESISEDRHSLRALIFLLCEHPAINRGDSQNRK